LIVALEAALREEHEPATQLETRLQRIEEHFGVAALYAVPHSDQREAGARAKTPRASIDAWRWA
jgi:hypothetical protein